MTSGSWAPVSPYRAVRNRAKLTHQFVVGYAADDRIIEPTRGRSSASARFLTVTLQSYNAPFTASDYATLK